MLSLITYFERLYEVLLKPSWIMLAGHTYCCRPVYQLRSSVVGLRLNEMTSVRLVLVHKPFELPN